MVQIYNVHEVSFLLIFFGGGTLISAVAELLAVGLADQPVAGYAR